MKREGSFTILWTMPMLNGQNLNENINDNVSRFIRVRKKKKKKTQSGSLERFRRSNLRKNGESFASFEVEKK